MAEKRKKTAGRTKRSTAAPPIRFEAPVQLAGAGRAIVRLPEAASKALPSRGQVAVRGTLEGCAFELVLEPDGEFGHWMSVGEAEPGAVVAVELEVREQWPEPRVPQDLRRALSEGPEPVRELWRAITPMARWEWVRWVEATKNPGTRSKRVAVSVSKLSDGKRRPCCFNLSACTDAELSKSGKLFLG